jgi:SAM-dependent methyltransferase
LRAGTQATWRRHSDAVNAALVARWLESPVDSVLKTDLFDEAVSDGIYEALATRVERVVGIDISPAIVAAAAARHPELVALQADVRELPFRDGEFDAILSNSTLDHFDSTDQIATALRELLRVLRPGGTVIVTLDNPWNPVVALGKALPRRWLNRAWTRMSATTSSVGLLPYYVGATLSLPRLRRLLGELGLHVTDSCTIVHAPRVLVVLAANLLERRDESGPSPRVLHALAACEALANWPTHLVTGHFVAVRATKPR